MAGPGSSPVCRCRGEVTGNEHVCSGLIRLSLALPREPGFVPGQFAMLNLPGPDAWTFGRPLSILDWQDGVVSFLYRVVGRGTAQLAALKPGDQVTFLGPLGTPFPTEFEGCKVVLVAGGVGLPPLFAWRHRFPGSTVAAYFGARNGEDVPWSLLGPDWQIGVEEFSDGSPEHVRRGLVTDLLEVDFPSSEASPDNVILACGPWPMLKAVHSLARERRWTCWLSLEEHMGCGYGACKGCVVPVNDGDGRWRPATCCQEGPVFDAERLAWSELE